MSIDGEALGAFVFLWAVVVSGVGIQSYLGHLGRVQVVLLSGPVAAGWYLYFRRRARRWYSPSDEDSAPSDSADRTR